MVYGLVGYYRIFIRNLSKIGHSIATLQKKGAKFLWISECNTNVEWLKHLLIHAPMLKIVDPGKDFMVCMMLASKG